MTPGKALVGVALDDELSLLFGEVAEGRVERDAARARHALQILPNAAVARLGPGLNDALVDGLAAIGDHQIDIEVDGVAKSLAARARAVGIVEGKQARLGLLIGQAAIFAFKAIAEDDAFGGGTSFGGRKFEDGFALAVAIADFDGVGQARTDLRRDGQAIHEHIDGLREIDIQQGFRGREFVHAAILIKTVEAALLQIDQGLRYERGRGAGRLSPGRLFGGLGEGQTEQDIKSAAGLEGQDAGGDVVDGVAADLSIATNAEGAAGAGVEQAQVVVDFGGRGHRRSRIAGGVFLLDGNGRRDAGNFIDVGLFDALQELPRVGGERFDVTPLAFGVDGVKGEAGFSRARDAGNHGDGVVRDFEADVFQVVHARAGNGDGRRFELGGDFRGDFGFFGYIGHEGQHSRIFGDNLNRKLYVS